MTRINVVPVEELHPKHLVAEYREIVRVFALVRKRTAMIDYDLNNIPDEYVLGTGHVKFFFNKLHYVLTRYKDLTAEMFRRGFNANPISDSLLTTGIDSMFFNDYVPTESAVKLNRERIKLRMPKEKHSV